MKEKKFLDYLLNARLLDPAQLRVVQQHMHQTNASLVEVVAGNGLVEDIALARALGAFHGYKVVDIERVQPKREALARAHGSFCRKHHIMPFGVDRDSGDLLVAVSDPYQAHDVLKAFQVRTSQRIRPYVAGRRALTQAIESHYFGQAAPLSHLANLGERPSQMGARTLEISSMGAVPGYGDSGMGQREPAPSLSQFGVSLSGATATVQAHPSTSSVDRFFEDAVPTAAPGTGWGAGGDILNAAPADGVPGTASSTADASSQSIEELKRENQALKQQVQRLEASVQLEINLVRQVVEMLLQSGAIDRQTYLDKMSKLR